jgi:hypothetical protein
VRCIAGKGALFFQHAFDLSRHFIKGLCHLRDFVVSGFSNPV